MQDAKVVSKKIEFVLRNPVGQMRSDNPGSKGRVGEAGVGSEEGWGVEITGPPSGPELIWRKENFRTQVNIDLTQINIRFAFSQPFGMLE